MKKQFKKGCKIVAVFMAIIFVLAACSNNDTGKKVLNIAREIPSDTINYLINETANNSQIIANFSEGLVTYDASGKLVGGQAESWTHKDNVYTFKLRDGLTWSDGTPLTASDFVFGWRTLLTLPQAPYRYFMTDLLNGEEVMKGVKPSTELGVKALDDRTLEVTLVQDRAYILEMLAHTTFSPLNEAFYTKVGADNYGTSPDTLLASGAFKLTEYNPSMGYKLVKNPHYWNAANVQLDEVNTRVVKESATQDTLFQNDEIDALEVTSNLADKYRDDPRIMEIPTARIYYFYISGNTATPAPDLANINFRKAIGYAIDKEVIASNILKDGSTALDYIVPRDFADVNGESYRAFTGEGNDDTYKFNVEIAQDYLAKAKEALGKNNFQLKIAYPEKEENRRVFENIQSQLQTNLPGVNVTLESIPGQTYFKGLGKRDTPAAYSGWAPDYQDVATYFQIFLSDNSLNFSNYNNARYDELYQQAQAERDPVKRAQLFRHAEAIILEDNVIIPLAQRGKRYVVKDKVKGFHFNSVSPEIDFRFIDVA